MHTKPFVAITASSILASVSTTTTITSTETKFQYATIWLLFPFGRRLSRIVAHTITITLIENSLINGSCTHNIIHYQPSIYFTENIDWYIITTTTTTTTLSSALHYCFGNLPIYSTLLDYSINSQFSLFAYRRST